jgi:hypothetical protein
MGGYSGYCFVTSNTTPDPSGRTAMCWKDAQQQGHRELTGEQEATYRERSAYRRGGKGFHDGDRVTVPAPDEELPSQGRPALRVDRALVHHVKRVRMRAPGAVQVVRSAHAVRHSPRAGPRLPLQLRLHSRSASTQALWQAAAAPARDRPTTITSATARRCDRTRAHCRSFRAVKATLRATTPAGREGTIVPSPSPMW